MNKQINLIFKVLPIMAIASTNNVIGNWWNHKVLQTNSQISPISGSIKEQVVTFIGKEKITFMENL